ncbi:MAG: erythromycin esterase family protein [Polyangiaceae bacterium]
MRAVHLSPSLLPNVLGWIALGASLAACAGAPPDPAPPSKPTATPTGTASAPLDPSCVLAGVVDGPSGMAVRDALVAAIPAGGEAPAEIARSDKEGRFCFKSLGAGKYGFTITSPQQTAHYVDVQDFEPGPKPQKMDLHLFLPPGQTLSGRVTDEKGAPVPSVRVQLSRSSNYLADLFVTETDADGRYKVMLPQGEQFTPKVQTEDFLALAAPVEMKSDVVADLHAQRLNPRDRPAPDEVVAWVKEKAIVLRTTEAGTAMDDMEPLRKIVGDARLVAMGEATHGSREFFQMKHRMLEFLVTKMGFRSFGIEASFGDCLPLSEYVRTGKGDPAAALANQGFWTWDTEEVLALVKWMRAYNADAKHKEKVSFWGFDVQSTASSAQALEAYLEKVDPAFAKEIAPDLTLLDDDFSSMQITSRPKADVARTGETTKKIADKLDKNKDAYSKKTSARDLAIAKIHANVLVEYVAMATVHDHQIRDRAMAKTVSELLDLESEGAPAKMALWAHNGHIDEHDNDGAVSMGAELARVFDKGYVTFGFSFEEGSFQAIDMGKEHRGLMPFTIGGTLPGTLDHTLSRAQIPLFALDLRGAPAGKVTEWLSHQTYARWFGATFQEGMPYLGYSPVVPSRDFDALFFVQKTTAARANDTGKVPPRPKDGPPDAVSDPGFEAAKAGEAPPGWRPYNIPRQLEYKATILGSGCAAGKQCVGIERTKGDVATGTGSLNTSVNAAPYRGKKVRVTASVRVDSKSRHDRAFLTAFARMDAVSMERVPGVNWTQIHVDVDVPADAGMLTVGLTVTGRAKAALDEIEVKPL